jgi:S-adenosylmethionine:tRNA ribosyltransferase-isomerase
LALIRGKVRVGDIVNFDDGLSLRIEKLNNDGTREVIFLENQTELDFSALLFKLDKIGHIPLPPYIHREDNESDGINYQSSFAKHPGSVAAPTASLHFDKKLLDELKKDFAFSKVVIYLNFLFFLIFKCSVILNVVKRNEESLKIDSSLHFVSLRMTNRQCLFQLSVFHRSFVFFC